MKSTVKAMISMRSSVDMAVVRQLLCPQARTLSDWEIFALPMDPAQLKALKWNKEPPFGPAFHRGTIDLPDGELADTFLDMRNWKFGAVWVNGHNLGRFWHIGPQQTLFLPGCWLKPGRNEIVVFDLEATERASISGTADPILDEVP